MNGAIGAGSNVMMRIVSHSQLSNAIYDGPCGTECELLISATCAVSSIIIECK